jgi:MFS transporter, DHA2 family, methylenomycin A resistance protein
MITLALRLRWSDSALLPLTVGTLAGPFLIYPRLSRRFGHPVLLVVGFTCCALGVAALAPTDAHSAYGQIAFGLLLIGLASTVSFSALTSLLLASVTHAIGSRLPVAFAVLGVVALIAISVSTLSLGR